MNSRPTVKEGALCLLHPLGEPSYLHGHSGFCERVLAIRGSQKRPRITESDAYAVLPALSIGATYVSVFRPTPRRTPARGARSKRRNESRHAAALRDGHAWHDADRLASARARRAPAVTDLSSAGTASPAPEYISSGVCPRKAECAVGVVFVDVEPVGGEFPFVLQTRANSTRVRCDSTQSTSSTGFTQRSAGQAQANVGHSARF